MLRRSISADRHTFADAKPASLNRRRSVSFTVRHSASPHPSSTTRTGHGLGAWSSLSDALLLAFAESSAISPEHPAMRCLAECDWQRLRLELAAHQTWEPDRYTRSPLLESDDFVVLLLCWSPGCSSPVHAHSDATTHAASNCFMLILDGELTETLYPPDALVHCSAVDRERGEVRPLRAGQTGYINDEIGVHKVANGSSTKRALSLHVYAPKWSAVPLYDEVELDGGGAPITADGWGDF